MNFNSYLHVYLPHTPLICSGLFRIFVVISSYGEAKKRS
jgi:hypothetical protein